MTEKANIGALTIDLLLENRKFKSEIKKVEADTKALGENLKRYGTFTFPIDTPMKKMVEVMKEANRKAKIEGQVFGRTLDTMAAKMKAMTLGSGIISPLKVSPLKRQFMELGETVKSRIGSAMTFAVAAVSKFVSGARTILNGLKNFIFNWKTLIAGAIAAAFTIKAVKGVVDFAKKVISASSAYEDLRLTLGVLLKDQKKSNDAFDEARELASKTAFSIEQIVSAYAQLLTFRFEQKEIPRILMLAADAATAFRTNIDEVVRALSYIKAGRAGEGLESLARFGISREALKARGIEFSAGGELKSSFDAVLNAIYAEWEGTIGGMSKEGQKTWRGMVSNFWDDIKDFLARIGHAGFFESVKKDLKFILDKIAEWKADKTLQKWAEDISGKMIEVKNGILEIFKAVTGLDLTGGKRQLKDTKKMTPEEIALFVLGFTPEDFKNAMTFMTGGPGNGRTYLGITSDADRAKVVEDAKRLGQAIHDAAKGELDTGDYFTEAMGGEDTNQKPAWVQGILDWITKIKGEIAKIWDEFSMAWKGKDKRGSRDAHGILAGGFEGIGRTIATAITDGIESIDWLGIIERGFSNTERLIAVGAAIANALGTGIEKHLSENHPIIMWLWRNRTLIGGTALGPMGMVGAGIVQTGAYIYNMDKTR